MHRLLALLLVGPLGLRAQAVPRTDTPRAGSVRATFDPVISIWDDVFTRDGRRPLGASLPATVHVHAEQRVTPLALEFGVTNHIAITARLPLVRVMNRQMVVQDSAGTGAALDSTLADSTYLFAPIRTTRRGLRYFPGDAELGAKVRVGGGAGRAAAEIVARFPTGHQDSPNDLFDIATGDHQSDIEARLTTELTLLKRIWLNAALRAGVQRPGIRGRRVAPQDSLLVRRAALALLDWDPGDYAALDVAPMLRLGGSFAVGFTGGYFTKRRDRYSYRAAQDSVAVAAARGAPTPAAILDPGTSERRLRLGVAMSYVGPNIEGGLSVEQTVTASGGRIPRATVFRFVLRTSRQLF